MKKTRKAHLWIGLICSIFIFMESITGLIMNEPWLIGQSQMGDKGDFPSRQMNFNQQGSSADSAGTVQDLSLPDSESPNNAIVQIQGQNGTNGSGQISGQDEPFRPDRFRGDGGGQGSLMGIIRGLHEGRMGTTNIKWLIDLTAIAMIFLTGTGIYLSLKVLSADKKRKRRKMETGAA